MDFEGYDSGIEKAVALAGSQERLAKEIGVSPQAVSEWVCNGYVPKGRVEGVLDIVDPDRVYLLPRDLIDPVVVEMVRTTFSDD